FKREFRCTTGGCRQLCNACQFDLIALDHAPISFAEEDRLVPSRSIAKIGLKPINQTLAVIDMASFNCPFEAMRIAVCAIRERRRKPSLQLQERLRRARQLFSGHQTLL